MLQVYFFKQVLVEIITFKIIIYLVIKHNILELACPIHQAPHGARDLMVLNNETRCWLNNLTASI